jgi:hypothetical protein
MEVGNPDNGRGGGERRELSICERRRKLPILAFSRRDRAKEVVVSK